MNPKTLKISSCFVLILAAAAMAAEGLGHDVLDNFKSLSRYDPHGWAAVLFALAMAQMLLLYRARDCLKWRVWSDFVLQLSGLALLIIGGAAIAVYPPMSWMMGVFPMAGMLFAFSGSVWAKRTRKQLRGNDE